MLDISERKEILTLVRRYLLDAYSPITELALWACNKICDTDRIIAATNGRSIFFGNGFFSEGLTLKQKAFIYKHELMHIVFQHIQRGERLCHSPFDDDLHNILTDLFINDSLSRDSTVSLPTFINPLSPDPIEVITYNTLPKCIKDCLPPPPHTKYSTDELFEYVKDRLPKTEGLLGAALKDLNVNTEELEPFVIDVQGIESDLSEESAADHLTSMFARMAKSDSKGGLFAQLKDYIPQARTPWRQYLRNLLKSALSGNLLTNWHKPSVLTTNKIVNAFLPSTRRDKNPIIYIAFDSSGSCWTPKTRLAFAANVVTIASQCKAVIILALFDVCIHKVVVFNDLKRFQKEFMGITYTGGGGTDFSYLFNPSIADIEGNVYDLSKVSVGIVLTDLVGTFPKMAPKYPVIWAGKGLLKKTFLRPPFGRVLDITD